MTQIAVRVPDELVDRLDELVPGAHANRSDAVRRAIELYLHRLAGERDAAIYDRIPLSDDELALVRDPGRWETAPRW